MDTLIINFDKLKQKYLSQKLEKKEQLICECQQEILRTEEQIRLLITQINELQSNIDFNNRLITKINHSQTGRKP